MLQLNSTITFATVAHCFLNLGAGLIPLRHAWLLLRRWPLDLAAAKSPFDLGTGRRTGGVLRRRPIGSEAEICDIWVKCHLKGEAGTPENSVT
ncbi:MAG: hypothetical protein VB141_11760 [Burkholderia gladioli]